MTLIFGVCESFLTLLFGAFYPILRHFAGMKTVSVQMLRRLARVSLALGQFAAERLTTTDTPLNRCYSFQKSLIHYSCLFPFYKKKKCLDERVRAVINSLL